MRSCDRDDHLRRSRPSVPWLAAGLLILLAGCSEEPVRSGDAGVGGEAGMVDSGTWDGDNTGDGPGGDGPNVDGPPSKQDGPPSKQDGPPSKQDGPPIKKDGGGPPPVPTFKWTTFTAGASTKKVYLSSSSGNDSNACTQAKPCKTLLKGYKTLRDGYPDWLLLKRGDVWTESFADAWNFSWDKSGKSASEPMLLSSYGSSGARPRLDAGQEHGWHHYNSVKLHDVGIVDLHFRAHTRDPYSSAYVSKAGLQFQSGIRWTGGGSVTRLLIEGCLFEYFKSNIAMAPQASAGPFTAIKVRGNVLWSAWSGNPSEYSQGIYADNLDGLLLEGNVIVRNGGLLGYTNDPDTKVPAGLSKKDVAVNWYNHQAYIQSGNKNVTARNNIFASGDGMQLRPGGVARDNLFYRCINSLTVGSATTPVTGGVTATLTNNVFLEGTDFAPECSTPGPRANAILLANINKTKGALVKGNLFVDDISTGHYGTVVGANGANCGSGNAYPCTVHNVSIEGNTAHEWRGGIQLSSTIKTQIGGITVKGNVLHNPTDTQANLVNLACGWDATQLTLSGNRYHRGGATTWFRVKGTSYDYAGFIGVTKEAGSKKGAVSFVDAARTLGKYNALQGGAATAAAFLKRARQQSKANWSPAYEAVKVNAYLRAGFTAK
jgi:hypothetical protein